MRWGTWSLTIGNNIWDKATLSHKTTISTGFPPRKLDYSIKILTNMEVTDFSFSTWFTKNFTMPKYISLWEKWKGENEGRKPMRKNRKNKHCIVEKTCKTTTFTFHTIIAQAISITYTILIYMFRYVW